MLHIQLDADGRLEAIINHQLRLRHHKTQGARSVYEWRYHRTNCYRYVKRFNYDIALSHLKFTSRTPTTNNRGT